MRFVFLLFLVLCLQGKAAFGQKIRPEPGTPGLPANQEEVPTGAPEPQAAPDLLPESNQLPALLPDLRLPSPSILKPGESSSTQTPEALPPLSPEEKAKNQARLAEIRSIAMCNPKVIDMLKMANGALSDEAKREFLRAYYHTLCTRMRYLDPKLGQTITAYERVEIRKLAAGPSHISIVSRYQLPKERQRRARSRFSREKALN